jgi:citrate lyase subunit beta / citryl-CoA lyase
LSSVHEGGRWPGIELYYPPIKYNSHTGGYESEEEAEQRFWRRGATTTAHTLLLDLEDGCHLKKESRGFLRKVLPKLDRPELIVGVRINQFLSAEYARDLEMIEDLKDHIHVIELAKAGEAYGAAEIRDLCSQIIRMNAPLAVEPIIEHPKSLKIVADLMTYEPVSHVVFGIHDFSKAMGIRINPWRWVKEMRIYRDMLLFEARIAGKGVVGSVDTLIGQKVMPDLKEPDEVDAWLKNDGDPEARAVYEHACEEAQFGMTGKQTIHPFHVPICRAAFVPSPNTIAEKTEILRRAVEADALLGGAILYRGEMLDPPMFGKALQTLLRAAALGALEAKDAAFTNDVIARMPDYAVRENWPYSITL